MTQAAMKFDGEKPRMGLIPKKALIEVAKVLTFGAQKYDAHNWRKGLNFSRLEDAAERHIAAWSDGADADPESDLSHLAHAICCLMFALEFVCEGRSDLDDRHTALSRPKLACSDCPEGGCDGRCMSQADISIAAPKWAEYPG